MTEGDSERLRKEWYKKVYSLRTSAGPSARPEYHNVAQDSNREIAAKAGKEESIALDNPPTDSLVVSALPEEHHAIKRSLFYNRNTRDQQVGGQYFTASEVRGLDDSVTVATTCFSQMGMVPAAILTTRALISLKPKLVIIGGICAGVEKKTKIGDLVIGSDMFNYDSKKVTKDKELADYSPVPIHWDLQNALNAMLEDQNLAASLEQEWTAKDPRPEHSISLHLAPFASGSAVIADSEVFEEIKQHQRRVRGLDMETFGVAKAVHYESNIKFLAVKSVCDFGNEEKAEDAHDNDKYRSFCCAMSAAFIKRFLNKLPYRSLFSLNQ
jgi:nucleoside phosphorylase